MPHHIQCPKTGQTVNTADLLLGLLCIAHRDGGQHYTSVGVEKAYQDACDAILSAYHKLDDYTRLLEFIRDNVHMEYGGEKGLLAWQKAKEAVYA